MLIFRITFNQYLECMTYVSTIAVQRVDSE